MVGDPATIAELRRVQAPFTVDVIAQIAATEAIKHQDRVAERVQTNAEGVKLFTDELTTRGIEFADSQCNFVYMHPGDDGAAFDKAMWSHGILVRPWPDGWIRVTIGTEAENRLFFAALDDAV
jgi:histidinol-phosphate aminotransferase